jgi:hypothetical protein
MMKRNTSFFQSEYPKSEIKHRARECEAWVRKIVPFSKNLPELIFDLLVRKAYHLDFGIQNLVIICL